MSNVHLRFTVTVGFLVKILSLATGLIFTVIMMSIGIYFGVLISIDKDTKQLVNDGFEIIKK